MSTLIIRIVDSEFRPLENARATATTEPQRPVDLKHEAGAWIGQAEAGARVTINASAGRGMEPETHRVRLRSEVTQVVIGLRRPGQLSYSYGDDRRAFSPVDDAFLLQVRGPRAADTLKKLAQKHDIEWVPVLQSSGMADDLFLRVAAGLERVQALAADLARSKLEAEVARVIAHGDRPALGLTRELVVCFHADVKRAEADRLAASVGLRITRELRHAGNAFVLEAQGPPSYDLLKAADTLAESGRVVYAEPNLRFALEADQYTPNDPLWGQLPHLQLIEADAAWDLLDNVAVNLRGGSPAITVAVIDLDGVAPNHPDLTAALTDGTGKLVSCMNFAAAPIAAQTVAGLGGDHGTQCAGSATAAFDDDRGIAGVAPNCHLIGARIGGSTTAVQMADIYLWVGGFMNGSTAAGFPAAPPARAADVISSSWGATGLALSNTIRDCFDFLTSYGRAGKGCVLCFSLGNSGYGDYTDAAGPRFRAWPTYEKTLGVGASINTNPTNPLPFSSHPDHNGNSNNLATAVDRRALFSPFGATALRKPDLVAPAHTAYSPALVDPILSTVRVGTGNVDGCAGAATCNDYAVTFGGTSHATPTVAGAVGLLLSARPTLNWVQVREILRQSCVRIDAGQANAIGVWQDLDGDAVIDYSRWYGAGRLDVAAAVGMALDGSLPFADLYVRENLADTGTVPSSATWWESPDIWVRQDAATPIPALAWGDPAPHQNAKRGQPNALFCRVRNRGAAAAPVVYVRALLTHWAGLEFVFPADFEPSNNVGAPVPNPLVPGTYLIGEARIDNLAVGASQIVKFTWPQALVPPETVMIGSATVKWHPCLLVDASPHDGPAPIGGLSVPVQGNNNIAQRNITIDNAGDSDADFFVGMIAGTRDRVGIATLILDASALRDATAIRLHVANARAMKQLLAGAAAAAREQAPPTYPGGKAHDCAVVIEERTRLRVSCGRCEVVIEAAAGSRVLSGDYRSNEPIRVQAVQHHGLEAVEIQGLRGSLEIPLRLDGAEFAPLLAAVTGPGAGDLWVSQRRGDGEVSAGYGIRRV